MNDDTQAKADEPKLKDEIQLEDPPEFVNEPLVEVNLDDLPVTELGVLPEPIPTVTAGTNPLNQAEEKQPSITKQMEKEFEEALTPEANIAAREAARIAEREAVAHASETGDKITNRLQAKTTLKHVEAYFDDASQARETFGGGWKTRHEAIYELTSSLEAALKFLEGSSGKLEFDDYNEAVITYNALAKLALEMRPIHGKDAPQGQDLDNLASFQRKFERIGKLIFGPKGPQVVTEDQMLYESVFEQWWHGHDIGLAITKRHIDTRLGQDHGTNTDLALFRQHDGKWRLRGYSNDTIVIPVEGVTIGRSMEIPGLESTQMALERDRTVANEHVRLEPGPNNTLRISNLSERGTHRHEIYWGTSHELSFEAKPRTKQRRSLTSLLGFEEV